MLSESLEEAHGDGLSETEHLDTVTEHVVLERGPASDESQALPFEPRGRRSACRDECGVAHLGVDHLVTDYEPRVGDDLGRRRNLNEPEPEVLRDRGRPILRFDAPEPFGSNEIARGFTGGSVAAACQGSSQ